jgi:hypothetical protein
VCAQCLKTGDCSSGGHCLGNQCVTFTSCGNSRDCGTDQVCDPGRGICVQCLQAADCANGQACVLNKCVAAPTCTSSGDCGAKLCNTDSKICVDCLSDSDCVADTQRCVQSTCRTACASDKQCTPQGMLCDTATSTCVQCKAQTDCPASSYCEGGTCKSDICDSTQSACAGNGVAACNDTGSGWATATNCGSQGCSAAGGVASCGGASVDGGALPDDSGAPPPDGGSPIDAPTTCTTATATPCTTIPKFDGTQTVDGKDDDFCQVPSFVFNKASAGFVNNYNNIQDSEFPVVTARVAWSAAGLHAFFDVTDASVQSVTMADPGQALTAPYEGDSIELLISSSDAATGAPGGDNGTAQVTLAATGLSASVKVTNNGGIATTYTELPAAQYAQAKTATGYVIEVQLLWQGVAPSGGGKVRFDLAVNVADTNFGSVSDMRDAQMVLNQSSVSGQTSCPGAAEPWCDDRTWCSTTLQE